MKRYAILAVIGLTINSSWAQHYVLAPRYVPTRATFVVRDDIGRPVVNAEIEGGFRDVTNAGSRDRFKGQTDTNGVLIAKGQTMLNVGGRVRKEGYYQTITSVPLNMKQGVPMNYWDVTIPVVLKRIRNPIPMYQKLVENPYVDLWEAVGKYNVGNTARYDIVNGSFLPPHGEGEIGDMDFTWHMNIYITNKVGRAIDYDTLCEIRMTNSVDGICRGTPDGAEDGQFGSTHFSAYEAPVDGYTNIISFYRNVRGMKAEGNDDRHYLYYFRIRTQTNAMGQITNALYGQIHGQINGTFGYLLNPTPNDRNVEFDPNQNLFKNLSSLDEVRAP